MDDRFPPWPTDAKFGFGAKVQRCNLPSGKPPSYRFPGTVMGWYATANGYGYCVSGDHEPGNVLIFPEYMLEARNG